MGSSVIPTGHPPASKPAAGPRTATSAGMPRHNGATSQRSAWLASSATHGIIAEPGPECQTVQRASYRYGANCSTTKARHPNPSQDSGTVDHALPGRGASHRQPLPVVVETQRSAIRGVVRAELRPRHYPVVARPLANRQGTPSSAKIRYTNTSTPTTHLSTCHPLHTLSPPLSPLSLPLSLIFSVLRIHPLLFSNLRIATHAPSITARPVWLMFHDGETGRRGT